MILIFTLFLYILTSFFIIYISIKYKIYLWKILTLSILPILFFAISDIIELYPAPLIWFIEQQYHYLIDEIIPIYQKLFIPLTWAATSILYIKKRYTLSSIKTLLFSIIIFSTFSIVYFFYINTCLQDTNVLLHLKYSDILRNLFFISIFYYLLIFYYFSKHNSVHNPN
jgi:hypothetical protein